MKFLLSSVCILILGVFLFVCLTRKNRKTAEALFYQLLLKIRKRVRTVLQNMTCWYSALMSKPCNVKNTWYFSLLSFKITFWVLQCKRIWVCCASLLKLRTWAWKYESYQKKVYSWIALDVYFSYSSQNWFVQTFIRWQNDYLQCRDKPYSWLDKHSSYYSF